MNDKKFFFHIGYPKSASTTIQNNFFNNHSEIEYLSNVTNAVVKSELQKNKIFTEFYDKLCSDINYENSKIDFELLFSDIIEDSTKKTIVFSDEHCTVEKIPFEIIADRIKNLGIDFKIIIVIRNQVELLRSKYDMHPFHLDTKHITMKTVPFDEWYDRLSKSKERNQLSALNYFEVYTYYTSLFGKENVKILKFEDFVKDKLSFSNEISSFLEIDATESFLLLNEKSDNDFKIHGTAKWKNKYCPNMHLSKIIPQNIHRVLVKFASKVLKHNKTQLSDKTKSLIIKKFASSNSKLNQLLNLNLEKNNYPNS